MPTFLLRLIWAVVRVLFAKRTDLVAENLALRQQLIVLHRRTKRRISSSECTSPMKPETKKFRGPYLSVENDRR